MYRCLPAALLTALLLGVALVACGSDGDSTTSGGNAGTQEQTAVVTVGSGDEEETTAPTGATGGSDSGNDIGNPAADLSPEEQIDYAVKAVLASGVPDLACRQASTRNYVDTTFGDLEGCLKATVPGSAATYAEVSDISINGSSATAVAKPTGGPSDGETIKVKLVLDDGGWKVDSLKSNAPVGP